MITRWPLRFFTSIPGGQFRRPGSGRIDDDFSREFERHRPIRTRFSPTFRTTLPKAASRHAVCARSMRNRAAHGGYRTASSGTSRPPDNPSRRLGSACLQLRVRQGSRRELLAPGRNRACAAPRAISSSSAATQMVPHCSNSTSSGNSCLSACQSF